jgi:hypothetical protein
MLYAVCTNCTFLRAFGRDGSAQALPARCPACGGELMTRGSDERFQPTYLGRVSLELHATPSLERREND